MVGKHGKKYKEYKLRGYVLTPNALIRLSILFGIHFTVNHIDGKKMTKQETNLRTFLYCFEHGLPCPFKVFDDAFMVEYRKGEGWVNLELELEDEVQGISIVDYIFYDDDTTLFTLNMDVCSYKDNQGKVKYNMSEYADLLCDVNSSVSHYLTWEKGRLGPKFINLDEETDTSQTSGN